MTPAQKGWPNGGTQLFATPGDPVAQIRLPQVMGVVFAALNVNAVWVTMHVDRAGLDAVLQGLRTIRNFRGITVAIPYKPMIGALLDRVSTQAQAAGAVNMVRLEPDGGLFGDMVDGLGFVRGLARAGHAVEGATAWLVGAGGGGSAIAAALAAAKLGRLFVTDTDVTRAHGVVERLARHFPALRAAVGAASPDEVDIAINATPCGLRPGDPLPFDPAALPARALVCDIIMKPRETALLRAAQQRGLRIQHGQHMLDAQIPMYLDFFGIAHPGEADVIALASGA
jgi:shikimate dehydrogenase